MRGFLKSREGIFLLSTKSTTIGREGCDLVIPGSSGECIHATIDYIEDDLCFILQDLNSVQGIYVNDCCIRKTAVQLVPNDIVCFGYNGIPYEFLIEAKQAQSQEPGHDDVRSSLCNKTKLNHFTYRSGLAQLISSQSPVAQTLRCDRQHDKEDTDEAEELTDGAGWISGARKIAGEQCHEATDKDDYTDANTLRHQLNCLQNEVNRLLLFEAECVRKDDLIEQLREEITNLQNFVRLIEVDRCPFCQKEALSSSTRLLQLESSADSASQQMIVTDIEPSPTSNQVSDHVHSELVASPPELPSATANDAPPPPVSSTKLSRVSQQIADERVSERINERVSEEAVSQRISEEHVDRHISEHVGELGAELRRTRDDCNLSVALACEMQRDMIDKDVTISRMAKEIDKLNETLIDRDMHITALEENLQKLNEGGELIEVSSGLAKDREIALLRYKLKHLDTNKSERLVQVASLTDELMKCRADLDVQKQSEKKLKAELESVKSKNIDLERAERVARIDVEQLAKRLEKLRSRAVQTAFVGSKVPDKLVSDDDLLAMLKKCADDRGTDRKQPETSSSVKESKKK